MLQLLAARQRRARFRGSAPTARKPHRYCTGPRQWKAQVMRSTKPARELDFFPLEPPGMITTMRFPANPSKTVTHCSARLQCYSRHRTSNLPPHRSALVIKPRFKRF